MSQSTLDPGLALENWKRAWRPSSVETSYTVTEIVGEIPRELRGTLYRNGPSQQVMPDGGYELLHLFDGDALIHAYRIEDGTITFRSAFAKNECHQLEQEAGRLILSTFNVAVDDPTDQVFTRQQPNTNVIYHHGKLWALVENAPPFEMDPHTLESVGWDYLQNKMLGMSVTAHPKIDGKTGEYLTHGYQFMPPFLSYYAMDKDGNVTVAEEVPIDYPVMMHDCAITENYIIFPLCPLVFEPTDFTERGPAGTPKDWVRWEPQRGLKFAIRKREAGAKAQIFEAATPAFIFHPGNAYEENGKIYMDACSYLDGGALFKSLETFRAGEILPGAGAHPFLYEFDLEAGGCKETQLSDRTAEFPRLDDRLVGYKNRWGYAVISSADALGPETTTIAKYDRTGGPSTYHDFGPGQFPGEPIFVPSRADAGEDEGFVLTLVCDAPNDRSYLAILDAQNLEKEPLARAYLRDRMPMGFHGNWAQDVV